MLVVTPRIRASISPPSYLHTYAWPDMGYFAHLVSTASALRQVVRILVLGMEERRPIQARSLTRAVAEMGAFVSHLCRYMTSGFLARARSGR